MPHFNVILMKKSLAILLAAIANASVVYAESPMTVYLGYVKSGFAELISLALNLSFVGKVGVVAAVAIVIGIVYSRTRDTPANNLRKARALHKKATEMHQSGDEQQAAEHYQKAEYHREKAEV